MERKSSTLNKKVDKITDTNSRDQLVVKKVKPLKRWFNTVITIEVTGICVCLGLIIANLIMRFAK